MMEEDQRKEKPGPHSGPSEPLRGFRGEDEDGKQRQSQKSKSEHELREQQKTNREAAMRRLEQQRVRWSPSRLSDASLPKLPKVQPPGFSGLQGLHPGEGSTSMFDSDDIFTEPLDHHRSCSWDGAQDQSTTLIEYGMEPVPHSLQLYLPYPASCLLSLTDDPYSSERIRSDQEETSELPTPSHSGSLGGPENQGREPEPEPSPSPLADPQILDDPRLGTKSLRGRFRSLSLRSWKTEREAGPGFEMEGGGQAPHRTAPWRKGNAERTRSSRKEKPGPHSGPSEPLRGFPDEDEDGKQRQSQKSMDELIEQKNTKRDALIKKLNLIVSQSKIRLSTSQLSVLPESFVSSSGGLESSTDATGRQDDKNILQAAGGSTGPLDSTPPKPPEGQDLDGSWEEFTPDFLKEDDEESYRFLFPGPGLFRCSVSGLLFDTEGGGQILYRTAPWDRAQLSQLGQKPAGPLFDFQCEERCVLQLHLPHCEGPSTSGWGPLAVAHVADGGVELIRPHRVTDTHVIIDITGFSGYGVVRGEGSNPESVRALVLLFYKPPAEPDVRSSLSVFMVPRNIVIRDLQRTRRKLVGEEVYIETSPQCRLKPGELYALSICSEPGADSVLVQPPQAEFDEEHHDSYFPLFHVVLKAIITDMKLSLKEQSSSCCVWEREVCLLPSTVRTLSLSPKERLLEKRSGFIEGISDAVLMSLLDKLLEKRVISDAESESVEEKQSRRDRARRVLKIVTKKGEPASSVMLEFLCELDPFFCEHLGLKPRQTEQ